MRKRTSRRRWKARCRMGREIPMLAIVDYRLTLWFEFVPVYDNRDVCIAVIRP